MVNNKVILTKRFLEYIETLRLEENESKTLLAMYCEIILDRGRCHRIEQDALIYLSTDRKFTHVLSIQTKTLRELTSDDVVNRTHELKKYIADLGLSTNERLELSEHLEKFIPYIPKKDMVPSKSRVKNFKLRESRKCSAL